MEDREGSASKRLNSLVLFSACQQQSFLRYVDHSKYFKAYLISVTYEIRSASYVLLTIICVSVASAVLLRTSGVLLLQHVAHQSI